MKQCFPVNDNEGFAKALFLLCQRGSDSLSFSEAVKATVQVSVGAFWGYENEEV